MIGQTLQHYRIVERIGAGGMGEVYRARDTHLNRDVAVKVLPAGVLDDKYARKRFRKEADALAKLNHPHIATVFDFDTQEDVDFLVMEYVAGRTLAEKLREGTLPEKEVTRIGTQIAEALEEAHEQGVVHRDLKPGNIALTLKGQVKVLDFGIAKLLRPMSQATTASVSKSQAVVGTLPYMAPEQLRGEPADARTDIHATGAVLYEMATGQRPFRGELATRLTHAILHEPPQPPRRLNAELSGPMEEVILKCLEKNPADRYESAKALQKDLAACQARLAVTEIGLSSILRRPQFVLPALLLLLAIVAGMTWFWVRNSRVRWARNTALPEIGRLVERENFVTAFHLAREAERYLPNDRELLRLRRELSLPASIRTTPPGAAVYVGDYVGVEAGWELLGISPIENARVPAGNLRWRITKQGFEKVEAAGLLGFTLDFKLDPQGTRPPGMVRVDGGDYQLGTALPVDLQDYWLDKYEVTNKEYKEFVEAGGYRTGDYWKRPFTKSGHVLSPQEAVSEFRDATGRPGPSTWELGTYPEDQDGFPVRGVSWYEAAAYCEFVGKSLPTIYHWYKATGNGLFSDILRLSNFDGEGPASVGSYQGLGAYGTYDMAGNVKEWAWNQTGNRRYILGGSWSEPRYMFTDADAQLPLDRSPTNGFRCARYARALPEALTGPLERLSRDYSQEKPANDDIFRFYRSIYSYDRTDLNAVIESVDESPRYWRHETITFDAAYGDERVIAHLFLPKNGSPPYQTVIFFPPGSALELRSSADGRMRWVDFIIRTGRAVLFPVYQGTYERRFTARGPNVRRDRIIQSSKDLGRSIDYLETRSDFDHDRLAYYGVSMGASLGPILTAIEGRFKVSVLLSAGFYRRRYPSEVDQINFAPRAKVPVLMLNGREDFLFPTESSQKPLFHLLGAPEKDKRHVLFEGGHILPRIEVIKEILEWLDRYLGPVK